MASTERTDGHESGEPVAISRENPMTVDIVEIVQEEIQTTCTHVQESAQQILYHGNQPVRLLNIDRFL